VSRGVAPLRFLLAAVLACAGRRKPLPLKEVEEGKRKALPGKPWSSPPKGSAHHLTCHRPRTPRGCGAVFRQTCRCNSCCDCRSASALHGSRSFAAVVIRASRRAAAYWSMQLVAQKVRRAGFFHLVIVPPVACDLAGRNVDALPAGSAHPDPRQQTQPPAHHGCPRCQAFHRPPSSVRCPASWPRREGHQERIREPRPGRRRRVLAEGKET
jgi:hypothetical protein